MAASAPRFHRLAVADLRLEASDAVSLTFAIPPELASDYRFVPGQYLTLRTTMDGEEVRRSYSICSGPDDGELRIAVKKVDGGAFSSWAADELKAGDQLDIVPRLLITGRRVCGSCVRFSQPAFCAGEASPPHSRPPPRIPERRPTSKA